MIATVVVAIRSVVTYIGMIAYIIIVAPPAVLLGVFRWKSGMYAMGHLGVWLALTLAGIKYRVSGGDQVPEDSAVVFCSNHESNVDPPVLFLALHRQLHILYKAELHKVPIMGTVFDVGGFVGVDRGDRGKALESIGKGAASLRAGNSFLIFPEGTRSRTGALLPFKKGGFIMALEAQVPIVPVAVRGGRAAMRKGSALIHPVRVSVRVGRPIPTKGLTMADRDQLIAAVKAEVQNLLEEGPVWT